MTNIEKRMNDVEASVKFIAGYVKEHTDKVEKQLQLVQIGTGEEQPLSDGLKDEITELKKKIEELSNETRLSPIRLKSVDDVERRLESRVEKIEQSIIKTQEDQRDKIESKLKPLAAAHSDLKAIRGEIAPKLSYIETKLKKLQDEIDNVGTVDLDEINDKLHQTNERVDHALAMKKHLEDVESELSDIKKKIPHQFKLMEEESLKRAKAVSEQLSRAEDYEKKLKGLFEGELGDKIKSIEDQLAKLNSGEHVDTKHIETEIKRIEKELKDKFDAKLAQIDINERADIGYEHDKLKELEKKLEEKLVRLNAMEQKDATVEEGQMKKIKDELETKLTQMFTQLNKSERTDTKQTEEDLRRLKEELEEELIQKFSHLNVAEHKDIRHAEQDIKKLKEELEEDLIQKFSQLNLAEHKDIKHATNEVKRLEDSLGKIIEEKFSQLNTAEREDLKREQEALKQIRADLEEKFQHKLEQLDKIESKDTGHLQTEINKLTGEIRAEAIKLNEALETRIKEIEIDIAKLSNTEEKQISKTKEDMLARLANLEAEVSRFASFEVKDLNKVREEVHESREKVEKQMEESLTAMKIATAQRIKDIEEEIKTFADAEFKNVHKSKEELAAKLKELDEEVKKLREAEQVSLTKAKEELAEKMKEHYAELQKFEGREADIAKKIKDELKDTNKELESKVKTIEEKISKINTEEVKDFKKTTEEMKELKGNFENEFINRVAIDKRLKEIEQELPKFEHHDQDQFKKIEEAIDHFKKTELDIHKKELEEMRLLMESEAAKRLSAEKRIHETEAELRELYRRYEKLENVPDLEHLGSKLHDLERNMKMASVRLLTQQLNEYAKAMDRRIPNIVSREEYLRQVADINQRLKTIESPDLAPMGARVERLEHKIEEVAGMIRAVYNRVPVVVE